MRPPRPLRDRLYGRVVPCPDDGCECVLWPGAIKKKLGYGVIGADGGSPQLLVHRAAWELANGPIPAALEIDHVRDRGCSHRNCVNVAHLELVTHAQNMSRGVWVLKTHCPQGHPYDEYNTYRPPSNPRSRKCRQCSWDRHLAARDGARADVERLAAEKASA